MEDNQNNQSPEYNALIRAMDEYKAAREQKRGINLIKRNRAKKAFKQALGAYERSLSKNHF